MRVLTEFVHKDDIAWKEGVFHEGFPTCQYKYLSYDEISHDYTAIVILHAGEVIPARSLNKDLELFMLKGSMRIGSYELENG